MAGRKEGATMAQIFIPAPADPVPYAYIRKGEWGFAAWVTGRLTDDDLAYMIFTSYWANQYWFCENPYFDEDPDFYEAQCRLEVYRVYQELVSTLDVDAMGQVVDLLAP